MYKIMTADGYQISNFTASGELWVNNTSCGIPEAIIIVLISIPVSQHRISHKELSQFRIIFWTNGLSI